VVWLGVRGDNEWIELGERSQIPNNATLHTDPGFQSVIGRDCVIGHNAVLHRLHDRRQQLIGNGRALWPTEPTIAQEHAVVGRRPRW